MRSRARPSVSRHSFDRDSSQHGAALRSSSILHLLASEAIRQALAGTSASGTAGGVQGFRESLPAEGVLPYDWYQLVGPLVPLQKQRFEKFVRVDG